MTVFLPTPDAPEIIINIISPWLNFILADLIFFVKRYQTVKLFAHNRKQNANMKIDFTAEGMGLQSFSTVKVALDKEGGTMEFLGGTYKINDDKTFKKI